MAAVPSIGRAQRIEGSPAPEADRTRDLYEQYAGQIFRYCLNQLGSREEAEDAVQSTFLNAFRGIKRGVVPELEAAWLFKIAHNVCLSRRRSSWRRGRIESPADFEIVEELAPAPSRRADELIGLQDVLEQMPEQQRRAILLREWQGLSYREIADELEVSQAAVETLIFRARRALAEGLEQPPTSLQRKRVRRYGGVLANLLSSAQSFLLGGGAAVKVAATVAVVGAGAVVATAPVQRHGPTGHTQPTGPAAVPHVRHQAPAAVERPGRATLAPAATAGVAVPKGPVRHETRPSSGPAAVPAASAPEPAPSSPPPAAQEGASAPAEPAATTRVASASAPANGRDTAPGQAKKADDPQPAQQPAPGGGAGKDSAPGQAKKADPPSVPVGPVAVGTTIPPVAAATTPATADPAPAAPVTAGPPADNGNGRGKKDK